jgi:predicted Ser/Thr protein kinase/CheY-like chemotaxis protein
MSDPSAERLAQRILDLRLLDQQHLDEVWSELGTRKSNVDEFTRQLLRREFLTNWQLERLIKGETHGYFYGACKVLYMVGSGTFSRVYRAQNVDTGEIVAVKALRRRFSEDSRSTDQFFKEGEMGRRLRHPNIVPIYEVYSKGLTHYLVMEFVEGRNLREFVKTRKKVPPMEATRIMADITAGIAYAFANGIHHRDLKMSNVLISAKGQPKVVDFGLASFSEREEDEANPRTIDYAGLERATGVRKDDPRSDIFFLGCIYYNLATGKPPLAETKDRSQRLSKARYLNVTPILYVDPEVPAGVVSIVARAMEPNAERRYQTPQEMLMDLKTLLHRMQVAGERAATIAEDATPAATPAGGVSTLAGLGRVNPLDQKAVMVVESNAASQEAFRNGLKRSGYRVLVISDPERALTRFEDNERVAHCVIFSTADLGESCLEAFNRFALGDFTRNVPAILLLGGTQAAWKDRAELAPHRLLVQMPVKFREIRAALHKLIPTSRSGQSGSSPVSESTTEEMPGA